MEYIGLTTHFTSDGAFQPDCFSDWHVLALSVHKGHRFEACERIASIKPKEKTCHNSYAIRQKLRKSMNKVYFVEKKSTPPED